ncbi:MAG: metal-sulfur cluster assembly factor [Acidimicrobiia bacterium]
MSTDLESRQAQAWKALGHVLDPELDRPIVELGFVTAVEVEGDDVRVALRLPTFWCAPNFTWMMAVDAREALDTLPWVGAVNVELVDHHADDQISASVGRGRSFEEAFAGEADGDLRELRRTFRRKAFMARQDRLLAGATPEAAAEMTLDDLPDSDDARAFLRARRELGLGDSSDDPVLTDPEGEMVSDFEAYRRRIQLVRLSLEGNAALCRGLLAARYASGGDDA